MRYGTSSFLQNRNQMRSQVVKLGIRQWQITSALLPCQARLLDVSDAAIYRSTALLMLEKTEVCSGLCNAHRMATHALLSNFASTKTDNYDIKLAVNFQKQSAEWNSSTLIWASGIFLRKTKAHFLKCHVSKKGQQPRIT